MRGRPIIPSNTWKVEITSPDHGVSYDVRLLPAGEMLVEAARHPARAAVRVLLADGRGHHRDRLEVYRPGQASFAFHGLFREFAGFRRAHTPAEVARVLPAPAEAARVLPGNFMLLGGAA